MQTLVVKSDMDRFDGWIEAFKGCDINLVNWQDCEDKNAVDFALVWKPEPGALGQFPNLKIIFSIGAGLDHLKGENMVPVGVPIIRMVEDGLTAGMVEYVLYNTLRFHRFMPEFESHRKTKTWQPIEQIDASDRTVGILGIGVLGGACAQALCNLNFNVIGWSRSAKNLDGVKCFHGESQLPDVLAQSQILICLLPLTQETRHIISAKNLALLPKGAYVINAGRGGHQNEDDILHALQSGQLAGVALDVFEQEPLDQDNPLWDHPSVYITPHIASMTLPSFSAKHVYQNIQYFRQGQPLTHVADMDKGY